MRPVKLGTSFKTISITCSNGHDVARYRKPKPEWGERTHKLWLLPERLKELTVEPPLFVEDEKIKEKKLAIPDNGTIIKCGHMGCGLNIGQIENVHGTPAIVLIQKNLMRTHG